MTTLSTIRPASIQIRGKRNRAMVNHAHHWIVTAPDVQPPGEHLSARCKGCSARRTFPRTLEGQMLADCKRKAYKFEAEVQVATMLASWSSELDIDNAILAMIR